MVPVAVDSIDLDGVLPVDDGEAIGELGALLGAIHAALLERVSRFDREKRWMEVGATSMQSWLVGRLDVTHNTARGWVDTARALEDLPTITTTLGEGRLCLDQVRALCRFATPDDVEELLRWVPERAAAELQAIARDHEGVTVAEDNRSFEDREVSWWWSEDRRLHLKATLPPEYGVVVVKALQRIAYQALPDEQGCYEHFDARCADALRRMASQSIGADSDPDRATVVIHVNAGDLGGGSGAALVEDGPLLSTETARRLACDGRWQLFADFEGRTVRIGRISRRIPASLLRALRLRDRCCRFPGCERLNRRLVPQHHTPAPLTYSKRCKSVPHDRLLGKPDSVSREEPCVDATQRRVVCCQHAEGSTSQEGGRGCCRCGRGGGMDSHTHIVGASLGCHAMR